MLLDTLSRPLQSLRLSVTDRCNLRCQYCMPEEEYTWLPREELLRFEELSTLVDVFLELGVDKLRLTGGEPLLRKDLSSLVSQLSSKPKVKDLALTTNGVFLAEQAEALLTAGLQRLTVSLDTLQPKRFLDLTRRDQLGRVLEGLAVARRLGSLHLKLNTVVIRGLNDDELGALIEYGRSINAEVRFIEYMDVGGATHWTAPRVFSRQEILASLTSRYGAVKPLDEGGSAPAERFMLPDGTRFGVIASTTAPFCSACDRSRLTADGVWYLCLYARRGVDLRQALRAGASKEELKALITGAWSARQDRGAEQRLALRARGPFVALEDLKKDPRLEMHTRGG